MQYLKLCQIRGTSSSPLSPGQDLVGYQAKTKHFLVIQTCLGEPSVSHIFFGGGATIYSELLQMGWELPNNK